ncbi:putative nuclease [Hyphomonas neptunium ATCC 15444]|uniref:Putative nuclease n=2 Tax=Hyphomonas TaxID=85 RepID=Q0BWK3_HYPNA|nr:MULTISPECIES: thermonuclease family protein [Hyphomonas]ABI77333.1 putative nuclease [Hyphomonas neptunium ATCC 15444]KCZ94716.1 putative nuclease [Hyphomonas hirschiana VP5]
MFVRARIVPAIGFVVFVLMALFGARFASENAQAATELGGTVYWSDGDSGRLSDGTKFRLHGIDAPETGSLKQRGGAKCEAERELGYDAKAVAVELTRGREVTVRKIVGRDRYGRNVVTLAMEDDDLGRLLVAGGTHRAWDYDGGEAKPDWCGPLASGEAGTTPL